MYLEGKEKELGRDGKVTKKCIEKGRRRDGNVTEKGWRIIGEER